MNTELSKKKIDIHIIILIAILVIACFVYLSGSGWGLPLHLHPDEPTIVDSAIRMVENKTFEPDVFFRPDHFLIQLNSLIFTAVQLVKGMPVQDIAAEDPGLFYFIARIVTGLFAVASVFVSYLAGKKYSKNAGLICAALFAVSPFYTQFGHNATPDVPLTFFILLLIYFSICYMQLPSYKYLLLMTLMVSICMAIKYPGLILAVFIIISVVVSGVKEKKYLRMLKHILCAAVCAIFFLFLISPVLFTNFDAVLKAVTKEMRVEHLGADGLGYFGNIWFYFKSYLYDTGVLLLVFLALGGIFLVRRIKTNYYLLPIFYSFIYWLFLSGFALHWERWALPMFISPLLISGIGIAGSIEWLKANAGRIKHKTPLYIAFGAVLGLIGVNLTVGVLAQNATLYVPDTRLLSVNYCEENGITRENSLYETYTAASPAKTASIFEGFKEVDGEYYVTDPDVGYIQLSSRMYGRYKGQPGRYAAENAIYNYIEDNYELKKEFTAPKRKGNSPVEAINIMRAAEYMNALNESEDSRLTGPDQKIYSVTPDDHFVYDYSTVIYFDEEKQNFEDYNATGLSSPNEKGCWTNGNLARFKFTLPDDYVDLKLSFTADPYLGDTLGQQRVMVLANGVQVGELQIAREGGYSVTIPRELITGRVLDIAFEMPDAVSPESLGRSGDTRELGIRFHEMTLAEL